MQAVGPVAVTSTLLGNGLSDFIGSNENPNDPADPELQEQYNHAAVQVGAVWPAVLLCASSLALIAAEHATQTLAFMCLHF